MASVNLEAVFEDIDEYWQPRIAAEANGQHVRVAKLHGEFVWHHHQDEDELFFVMKGALRVKFNDREEVVREGELLVIPKGQEHLPIADEEVWLVNITKAETTTTGETESERATPLDRLRRVS